MLIAFARTRDKYGIKNERILKSVIYASEQIHHSCQESICTKLRILVSGMLCGLSRWMNTIAWWQPSGTTDRGRQNNGLTPFRCSKHGTTDTGAIDPAGMRLQILQKGNAMYGYILMRLMVVLSLHPAKSCLKESSVLIPSSSIPQRDVLPYGLGRYRSKTDKLRYTPINMQHIYAGCRKRKPFLSPSNLSPELTKTFWGLRMWLPLQIHGIEPLQLCLEESWCWCNISDIFYFKMAFTFTCAGFIRELFLVSFESDCDEKNKALYKRYIGRWCVLSSSIIDNRFVIRIAILAFRTKRFIIDRAMSMILRCLDKVK